MLISTLNCEMWPNFGYRGVRSVQLLLLLLLLMVFSWENFGFSPPYAGIAGIGPVHSFHVFAQERQPEQHYQTNKLIRCKKGTSLALPELLTHYSCYVLFPFISKKLFPSPQSHKYHIETLYITRFSAFVFVEDF